MAKLEGIIYKAFENFIVFRGYAPISLLARVSKRPEAYQRTANDEHKRDIIKFLKKKEYSYFPEIVFAYRGANLIELISELHGKDDVEYNAEKFVSGLKVLKERVPYSGYRARHAQLTIDDHTLLRVDGNHRLEPFDSDDSWWRYFIETKSPSELSDEDLKLWEHKQIVDYRSDIDNIIVPFSVVISNKDIADKFEASIFNNINFKQLPLRQEKNIQNIFKYLRETEELGKPHDLTIKLIDLVEKGHFKGLSLLETGSDNEIYRTVCLRTIELLITQREKFTIIYQNTINDINEHTSLLEKANNEIDSLKKSFENLENEQRKQVERDINKKNIAIKGIKRTISIFQKQNEIIQEFLTSSKSIDKIEIAIQSLRTTYVQLGEQQGNISLFVALVYFKLLDHNKFDSFVEWILKNGINKIPIEDYLPTHNPSSLISLFERVYEAKGKEIFISMQFGDPQSEMIYEKIVQTINRFNISKGLDIKITTIRIDQKATTELFSISTEITRAIENSSLIIADLSSRNINVYHEIGVAMGLAQAKNISPSVILLYKTDSSFRDIGAVDEDHFIGFNLRGESQLRFSTYKQLVDDLWNRLEYYYAF